MKFTILVVLILLNSISALSQSNSDIIGTYEDYKIKVDRYLAINNVDSLIITCNNLNEFLLLNFSNESWRTLPQNDLLYDAYAKKKDFLSSKKVVLKNISTLKKFNDTLSIGYAHNLTRLGNIQLVLNENVQSRKSLYNAGEIFNLNKDSTSIHFIKFLNINGKTENYFSNYNLALNLLNKANFLIEKYLKNSCYDDFDLYIDNLNDLSLSFEGLGEYEKSLGTKLKIRDLLINKGLQDSYDFYKIQLNISVSYLKLNKVLNAEELLLEGYEKVKNGKFGDFLVYKYIEGLNIVYLSLGDNVKSQKFKELALKSTSFNVNDLDSYSVLIHKAIDFQSDGNFTEAFKIHKYIVDEINRLGLPKGKLYLQSLKSLGELSNTSSKLKLSFDERKRFLLEASDLTSKLFDVISIQSAEVHAGFGQWYYFELHDYKNSITNYKIAIDIINALPLENRDNNALLVYYKMIANAYERDNDFNAAYEALIKALVIQYKSFEELLPFISELERDNFVLNNQETYSNLKSFIWRNSNRLKNKYIEDLLVLDDYYSALSLNTSKKIRKSLEELPASEREKYFKIIDEESKSSQNNLIYENTNSESVKFKREFLKQITNKNEKQKVEDLYSKLLLKTNFDGALVLFQRCEYDLGRDISVYSCLIISKDKTVKKYIPLFQESSLDSVLINSDKNASDLIMTINRFYLNNNNGHIMNYLKDIFSQIKQFPKISVISAGKLNFINFGAIEQENGRLLGEDHEISIYSSIHNFINDNHYDTTIKFDEIDIFSGLNYNKKSNNLNFNNSVIELKQNYSYDKFGIKLRAFNNTWNYLPGSKSEGTNIKNVLQASHNPSYQVNLFEDQFGDELSFRKLFDDKSTSKVVHLATHGFFFNKLEYQLLNKTSNISINENSTFRSGIILSGGNIGWKNFNLNKFKDDGILTSYEISQLDLSNLKLVVLSACDTGLGDINGDEGVFGLQRAFKIAGAEKIIMSLWKVPDLQTNELMTHFYKNLIDGKNVNKALIMAQRTMKLKYPPYYWAAFKLLN